MGVLHAIIASGNVGGGSDAASRAFYKVPLDQVDTCNSAFSHHDDGDDDDEILKDIFGTDIFKATTAQGKILSDINRQENADVFGGQRPPPKGPSDTNDTSDSEYEHPVSTRRTHLIQMHDNVPFMCCRHHFDKYIIASRTHHSTRNVINPWPPSSPIPYDYVMSEQRRLLEHIQRMNKKPSPWIIDRFDQNENVSDANQTIIRLLREDRLTAPPTIDMSGL